VKAKLRQAYKRWGKDVPDTIRESDTFAEMFLDIEALLPLDLTNMDEAIAERLRFAEAGGEDDHPYGAWSGGSKAGGGRPGGGGSGGGSDIPEIPDLKTRKNWTQEQRAAHYAKVDKLPDDKRRSYYDAEANAVVSGKLGPTPMTYQRADKNAPIKPMTPQAGAQSAGLDPNSATGKAYMSASPTNQRAFKAGRDIKPENVKTKADRDLLIAQRRQKGTARSQMNKKYNAAQAQQRAAADAKTARNTAASSNRRIASRSGQKGFSLGHRGTGALQDRVAAESRLRTRLRRQGRSQNEIDAAVRVFRSNTL
jgi:hypothetical protein